MLESAKKAVCNFCTIAGKEYLFKVLTLYNSLERHSKNFHLWICCNDVIVYSILTKMNFKNATPFPVSDLEDPELLAIKSWRKTNEYCWTIKASLIKYILNNYDVDSLIYCDGDLYFFSDPEPIFKEWGENSILLTPQRDLDWVHAKYGTYQAGLIGFKKDKNGLKALEWWRQKCIEWCYGDPQPELERWGDQKYLDKIPSLFQGVKISENLGVNAAPWNSIYNNNYNIYESGNDIFIESDKLICFHFACISIFNDSEFDLWTFMNIPMKDIIKNKFYTPYLRAIRKSIQDIIRYYDGNLDIFFSANKVSEAKTYFRYIPTAVGNLNYTSTDVTDTKVYPANFPIDTNNIKIYYKHSPINIKTNTPYQKYNFCSLVSSQYMIKELTLYHSLKKHSDNFHLWICCIDDNSYNALLKMSLENVSIIHVREIEDNELLSVKKTRTLAEYCWTLKAPLILHLIKNYNLNSIIYCDSDLYFFSNPQILFDKLQGYSMFMCRQRGDYELEKIHGSFQAGLLGFRNDKNSLEILHWWREKCIEWCSNIPDIYNERWGDQKYLDRVPHLFSSVNLINNLGINAAPWNLVMNNNHKVNKIGDEVFIENDKLVVYHFGSMLIYNEYEYDLWKLESLSFKKKIINHIYIPYIYGLKNTITSLKSLGYINTNLLFWRNFVQSPKNYFKL